MSEVTFKRVSNGVFEAFKDGVKSKYQIVNGCLGESGYGKNTYGIYNLETMAVHWFGSLQSAKKSLTFWLSK